MAEMGASDNHVATAGNLEPSITQTMGKHELSNNYVATAGIPEYSRSYVNPSPAAAPSPGHHRIPPCHRIYEELSIQQQTQKAIEKINFQLGKQSQEKTKLHLGNHHARGMPYVSSTQPFPCISHHSLPNAALALFHITDCHRKPISSNSPPSLPSHLFPLLFVNFQ